MNKITILLSAILIFSTSLLKAQDMFLTAIPTSESLIEKLPVDTKVKPQISGSSASSEQSGFGIARSFDDDASTLYHSSYSKTVFPVTLTYAFPENSNPIDYLIYYPRADGGSNGNIKEVTIYYKLRGSAEEVEYGNFDFKGSSNPRTVKFSNALENVEYITFKVHSGVGDSGDGFVSCSEMEFYQTNPDAFDYTKIFTDESCSAIKPGVTPEDINKIEIEFFKKLATDIYYGDYDSEFRVQSYTSYIDPAVTSAQNKTSKYGLRDNITGIYALKGESIIVFAESSDEDLFPSLFIQYREDRIRGTALSLKPGMNKFTAPHDGLLYVLYYTPTGTEKPIKINIASGRVNGYFDLEKHTAEQWSELLANATFSHFDAKGKYSTLNFETEAYRTYTKEKGKDLVEAYDNLVWLEQDFMGLFKYNKAFPTRMHFQVVYGDNFMYATDYFTGYNNGTQNTVLDFDVLTSTVAGSGWAGGAAWGPAHEVGHSNQTRPGLKWQGMTEVTNNIHSLYVTTTWGSPSRIMAEDLGGGLNRYTKAINTMVIPGKAHNDTTKSDVFCQLVPFWQLKLYMHDVLGKTDFYKDVYETVRLNPNPKAEYGSSADGMCQLEFTKIVSEISGLDMTEFFEDWGFFKPISYIINDYGNADFTVTQTAIDATKAAIADMKLPKPTLPPGKKLYEINDKNTATFKVE